MMAEALGRSVVKFCRKNGSRVGSGFVVSPRHIATCTHVISEVIDKNRDEHIEVGTIIDASLPMHSHKEIKVKVVCSRPVIDAPKIDDLEDITILEVIEPKDVDLPTLQLVPVEDDSDLDRHSFYSYGYRLKPGDKFSGTCQLLNAEGRIQLDMPYEIDLQGASGAPVWDETLKGVTGMLVEARQREKRAYMIPLRKLIDACPEWQEHSSVFTQKCCDVRLPDRPDREFESVIKEEICTEFEVDEAEFLKIALLQNLPTRGGDVTTIPELIDKLCQLNVDDAIDSVLYNATMECLRGRLKRKANKQRTEIKNIAEQILGWLVLLSVDREKINQLNPEQTYFPGIYFTLPVKTEAGVEIIISRKFQRQSSLRVSPKGSSVEGNYLVPFDPMWSVWKEDEVVAEIMVMLWNKIYPDDKKETGEPIDQDLLNEIIQDRREDKWVNEHYYLVINDLKNFDKEFLKQVFKNLLSCLSQLTVACIAGDTQGGLLLISENRLKVKINKFITQINNALGQTT